MARYYRGANEMGTLKEAGAGHVRIGPELDRTHKDLARVCGEVLTHVALRRGVPRPRLLDWVARLRRVAARLEKLNDEAA